ARSPARAAANSSSGSRGSILGNEEQPALLTAAPMLQGQLRYAKVVAEPGDFRRINRTDDVHDRKLVRIARDQRKPVENLVTGVDVDTHVVLLATTANARDSFPARL